MFDADYLPPKGILKDIAVSFSDPEIGAVMGRVIPINTGANMLTRLLDLERTGGYQVDQQARYNLKLVPQYGGTVGGFRKEFILTMGGFDANILAEDTELTFRLLVAGWKVIYANRAECYEEAPEDWDVRARQVMRWSRGHTQVMFKYLWPMLSSDYLSAKEKFDATLLLFIYTVPIILLLGLCDSLALFFLGEMHIIAGLIAFIFVGAYNTFGNFAPFYQIGIGSLLDGATGRILLLPFLIFNFFFNTWYMSRGFVDAIIDLTTGRIAPWQKTIRYRQMAVKYGARKGSYKVTVMTIIFVSALLVLMFTIPFMPGIIEYYRKSDADPLFVQVGYSKTPRYFSASFKRILSNSLKDYRRKMTRLPTLCFRKEKKSK